MGETKSQINKQTHKKPNGARNAKSQLNTMCEVMNYCYIGDTITVQS
jgi:hypothetical protein